MFSLNCTFVKQWCGIIKKILIYYINFFPFSGISQYKDHHLLVLEYADSGTLNTYLSEQFDELDWKNKLGLALQLVNAVSYLHEHGIIHHRELVIFYNYKLIILHKRY